MGTDRPKLAAVVTTYFPYSHGENIVDRFLYGYGWKGTHHRPPMDIVSLYVDQIAKNDLSRNRGQQFPSLRMCSTIAEALTLGGEKLAVDGNRTNDRCVCTGGGTAGVADDRACRFGRERHDAEG